MPVCFRHHYFYRYITNSTQTDVQVTLQSSQIIYYLGFQTSALTYKQQQQIQQAMATMKEKIDPTEIPATEPPERPSAMKEGI